MAQCEGYRRHGGAFSLGPVTWKQCTNDAIVNIEVVQGSEQQTYPACARCWQEILDNNITIVSVTPIIEQSTEEL